MRISGDLNVAFCDNPGCRSVLPISIEPGESSSRFTLRAQGQFIAEGWVKDAIGLDLCPSCHGSKAPNWRFGRKMETLKTPRLSPQDGAGHRCRATQRPH
jgi:hypothetical protein